MANTLCGSVVQSKRSLLALTWTIINVLAFFAFFIALAVALTAKNYYNNANGNDYGYYGEGEDGQREEGETTISMTSRAMAFVALWTALLSTGMGIYGTIVIGFVNPSGRYYWCCAQSVHATTQMSVGSFMGALLMYANLTLICAVLFGEFNVKDHREDGGEGENAQSIVYQKSSLAFSIVCIFLTVLYTTFAGILFVFSSDLMKENSEDMRKEVRRALLYQCITFSFMSTKRIHPCDFV
jgi:hypothetical protein